MAPRVSSRKETASLPPPPDLSGSKGKRRSVPPLAEHEIAVGEVQTLPGYGKLKLGNSSTGHSGLKEMQIDRKTRHEQAIEVYQKRLASMEVELETKTGHVAR